MELTFPPYDSYEKLYSLSDLYSNTLRRLHAHIIRIYSPGLANLARLPSTFTDGTQTRMMETVYGKLTDGSAYKLAERLVDSTVKVGGTLLERRKERESSQGGGPGGMGGMGGIGGMGGMGAFGGSGEPPKPTPPPSETPPPTAGLPPPPPSAPPVGQPGGWIAGRPPPEGSTSPPIGCMVM